jgi:hypothetical protein
MLVKVETEVSKEMYELALGLGKFVLNVKLAVADGFKIGEDFGPILASLMADVVPALSGVEAIPAELKEDKVASFEALALGFKPMIKELLK